MRKNPFQNGGHDRLRAANHRDAVSFVGAMPFRDHTLPASLPCGILAAGRPRSIPKRVLSP